MNRVRALVELQDADDRLAVVVADLAAAEAQLAADPDLQDAEQEAARRTAERGRAELAVRAADGDVAALRQKAERIDRRLFDGSVRNPAELLGLQQELDTLRAQVVNEEDRELTLMEVAEGAAIEERRALDSAAARRAVREASVPILRERVEQLRAAMDDARRAREDAFTRVLDEDRALYARIVARVLPAVARLDGTSCSGCHLPLGIHEARNARMGAAVVQCPHCDRILAP